MASTTVTYANLKRFVRDHLWEGFTETDDRMIDEAITGGIRELARSRQWSFLEGSTVIQTVAPVSFDASITNGTTTLTAGASTFAAGDVGKFVELAGQTRLYRIATYTSDTEVELERAYVGTTLSSEASKMVVLDYDLPTDFRSMDSLNSLDEIGTPMLVTIQQMDFLHSRNSGSSQPTAFWLGVSPDDGKQVIRFFPQPDAVYEYKIWYNKMPQAEGYSAGDYVDWPDAMMHLLKAAILAHMAKNKMIDPQSANLRIRNFEAMMLDQAADDTMHRRKRRKVGGKHRRRTGFNKRGYYAEKDVTWLP